MNDQHFDWGRHSAKYILLAVREAGLLRSKAFSSLGLHALSLEEAVIVGSPMSVVCTYIVVDQRVVFACSSISPVVVPA